MAAKTWEEDFRYPAIQASIRQIRSAGASDPLDYSGSFCVPVAEKPAVGWTPGKVNLVVLVLGFAGILGGGLLAALSDRLDATGATIALITGLVLSLGGITTLLAVAKLDKKIIRFLVGDRASHLFEQAESGLELLSSELSSADDRVTISIDGDDHVLILVDTQNSELQMEGTGARYRIRASDVTHLAPYQFMNYLGVEIRCRIDDETELHFAIARVSIAFEITRQIPILFFLRKRIRNRLLEACENAMPGVPIQPARKRTFGRKEK